MLLLIACSGEVPPTGGPIPTPSVDAADHDAVDTVGAETFSFTDSESLLILQVLYLDDGSLEHAFRPAAYTASTTWDSADHSAFALSFSVPTADILVDEDHVREHLGAEIEKESRREGVRDHLLEIVGSDAITMSGTDATLDGETLSFTANWTIDGASHSQPTELSWKVTDNGLYASGETELLLSDFGFELPTSMFGDTGDGMPLTIDLLGQR